MVALLEDLLEEADWESMTMLVLLDLSSAFDTVSHGILLDQLAGLGIGGSALH